MSDAHPAFGADKYNDPVVLTPADARTFAYQVLRAADSVGAAVPPVAAPTVPDEAVEVFVRSYNFATSDELVCEPSQRATRAGLAAAAPLIAAQALR